METQILTIFIVPQDHVNLEVVQKMIGVGEVIFASIA
jgi:hypothetical protein